MTKLSEPARIAYSLASLGFDLKDCTWFVEHAPAKQRFTRALRELYDWNKIEWHCRNERSTTVGAEITAASIKSALASEEAELRIRNGDGFRVMAARQGAWRVRFQVGFASVPAGTDVRRWDDDHVADWVRSVMYQYGLDPRTARRVISRCHSGSELLGLGPTELTGAGAEGWGLSSGQAEALTAAIVALQQQSLGAAPTDGPVLDLDLVACVESRSARCACESSAHVAGTGPRF